MKQLFAVVVLTLALAGCRTPLRITDLGPRYQPANVHSMAALPGHLRRAALLPLAQTHATSALEAGAEHLFSILAAEFRKAQAFEVVTVSPDQLQQWTGRRAWRADEALPSNLLARVRAETGCDGVIFATLTTFRAYPPLAVGWDLRLIDLETQGAVWAVEEVLDAGAQPVARSARDYSEDNIHLPRGVDGGSAVLHSPRRFGQFAAATLVATLPPR